MRLFKPGEDSSRDAARGARLSLLAALAVTFCLSHAATAQTPKVSSVAS